MQSTTKNSIKVISSRIAEALAARMGANATMSEGARQYAGMSVLEMARDYIDLVGHSTRGMDRFQLSSEMMQFRSGAHASADFPSILADAAHKRLRDAYQAAAPTYAVWARRAPNAIDFRPITVVQLSGAPDLLRTSEHQEFQYGSMSDGAETYSVITYGRMVNLTRQALINDDLRAFGRLVEAFGFAARRLENRLVYAQLTANAAMADGTALFHANHGNLGTGGGSNLAAASLTTGRTAMRLQKGMQSEELNLAPAYLVVPASLEQTAYQLTSANYVPATAGAVNEFRAGGRNPLQPVVETLLDSASTTAWYLAAASNQVDTVEYCYLGEDDGPVIETKIGFEMDAMTFKARLDFGAKAIDYRGLYKSNGA